MRNAHTHRTLHKILSWVFWLLGLKILLTILVEYRFYFPADFTTAFLVGRERTFVGLYRASFYVHIIVGPICIVLAAALIVSGSRLFAHRRDFPIRLHRRLGRLQASLVLGLLLPTGLVMSANAFAGPIAAVGFATLSLATAASMLATIVTAVHGRIQRHRRWAIRTLILLASPLLLRFVSGLLMAAEWESDRAYQLNAWASWLAPLFVFELFQATRLTSAQVNTPRVQGFQRSMR